MGKQPTDWAAATVTLVTLSFSLGLALLVDVLKLAGHGGLATVTAFLSLVFMVAGMWNAFKFFVEGKD